MKRSKIIWMTAMVAVSGAALAATSPRAHNAIALLAAQDDPAELSDIRIDSALRNNQYLINDQIEAALEDHDAAIAADLLAGIVVLASPFASIVTLAIVAGVWFVVIGVFEIVSSFGIRKASKNFGR